MERKPIRSLINEWAQKTVTRFGKKDDSNVNIAPERRPEALRELFFSLQELGYDRAEAIFELVRIIKACVPKKYPNKQKHLSWYKLVTIEVVGYFNEAFPSDEPVDPNSVFSKVCPGHKLQNTRSNTIDSDIIEKHLGETVITSPEEVLQKAEDGVEVALEDEMPPLEAIFDHEFAQLIGYVKD